MTGVADSLFNFCFPGDDNIVEETWSYEDESMQDHESAAERQPAVETPVLEWHKPVMTILQANSAENTPGAFPDAGVDFS
ncbi:hypothetical protein CO669_06875 [Bradyrhizobium sp. Y36]|uniref:hypothetical protein n=1 Tax=Bradyrhizobium sp. Y36 TaxID=2035447 RepID=UPI000BE84F2E|nr:hypothetical protein [Bradyrhizobium sp. Y36]PDT90708.1 hypothetical protein CO669_06875 [Bradyrhizobium sp. Y36]